MLADKKPIETTDASQLVSGTLPDARLSPKVKSLADLATPASTRLLAINSSGQVVDGTGVLADVATSGSASDLTSGTLDNARLSAQVARRDLANTFPIRQVFSSTSGSLEAESFIITKQGFQFNEQADNSVKWWVYKNDGDPSLYLRDMTNLRFHAAFTAGNSVAASQTYFLSRLLIDGVTTFNETIRLAVFTVATLPSASANSGHYAQVTDSNSTTNGAIVAGGGSNRVPVFSNGTNWIIK